MYQSFIGLEIHIQLLTKTKVFCNCRAAFGDEPNTNICPVCMGYPGVLPALNEEAVRMGYLVARALNCTLSHKAVFERKNYFYPDMPKNYQISQFASPIGTGGYMHLVLHKKRKRIGIREVHLEEDAGKMIHAGDISLLDYNRAGTPLLEIVTQPELEIGEEAEIFIQNFRRMVRYLHVCDGNMEEGSLRCDANVSVNLRGRGLGSKVEIKNLNSSKFVRKALNFEIARQEEILERGGSVQQETRLWNENRDVTESMRTKESAHDYRYFPEPDLPPFRPDNNFFRMIEESLSELPEARKERLVKEYNLSENQADFICEEKATADFFEAAAAQGADPHLAAAWLGADVQKMLNRKNLKIEDSPLTPERFASLLMMIAEDKIHGKIGKQVLEALFEEDLDPEAILKKYRWEQISDASRLKTIIDKIIASHSQVFKKIQAGDSKPLRFLVGQVMKATGGRAEPRLVQDIFKSKLSVSIINVLSMGGAIAAFMDNGMVVPGQLMDVKELFSENGGLTQNIRFEEIELRKLLSEEITPEDWAILISEVKSRLRDRNSSGLVIAHGTDTLAYTASLLYWFFADTPVPIVITASRKIPGIEDSAKRSLKTAVLQAIKGCPGVYVVLDSELLSPVNLKFERVTKGGFRNWNLDQPVYNGTPVIKEGFDFSFEALKANLEKAINQVFIAKVFPGMQGASLITLMNTGIKYFILELYDTGTANVRETPYSIKKALQYGKERGCKFFCTSQQEGMVDFSEYITSHELWKEGALPMGGLTTESAYTKLLISLLVSGSEEDVVKIMEEPDAGTGGRY
ncbi:MAG: Asp-tRNA(Asn)/Glu-tRNA(Gln) amidotransferase subunit GatB [Spirochaetota bacterium]